jgi:ribose transport system ATP-binding protein
MPRESTAPDQLEPVLRVEGVSKTFPGTKALDGVSMEIRRGEIHALIGTNGSGKSTLIKILAGVQPADRGGRITISGKHFDAERLTPAISRAAGLHFVHQVPAVFPALTVAENLAIGRGFVVGRGGRILWEEQRARAQKLIERFHIEALPDMPISFLKQADRTLVAIARALQDQEGEESGVLILDEPTASLPSREVDRLLEALQRYAALGQAIVYVTHRLGEVLRVSHRVSALRDGRSAGTMETKDLDESKLVAFMLGRPVGLPAGKPSPSETSSVTLSVRGLASGACRDATFTVGRGEILGIAGLLGSGAADVLRVLFGVRPRKGGEVLLDGNPYRPTGVPGAVARGVIYVPADRAQEAAFHEMSVRANLSGAGVLRYFRGGRLRHDVEHEEAKASIDRFLIRTSSDEQPLSTLSGGNQQKVILARWLRNEPRVALLDEPTQGVDINARSEIHRLLRDAARRGSSMIVVSSDFDELAHLCDRVLVMVQGRVVADVSPPSLDVHRLTELAHFVPEAAS